MTPTATSPSPEIAAHAADSERLRLASLSAGVRLLAAFVFLGLGLLGWGLSRHSTWRTSLRR